MLQKGMALCMSVLIVCVGIKVFAQEKSEDRVVSERLIAQIDLSSWIKDTFKVSPDGKRVAYAVKVGNKWFVVVDGKEEKQYDGIGTLIFSPDGKRMAYRALVGNKQFVVVDGKEEKQYDGTENLIFSPDSKRVAYEAKVGDKWLVVVDGKEEGLYDDVETDPIFSPDSKRVAYGALVGNKWFAVVDGKEGRQYDNLLLWAGGKIVFNSPDGLHYLAREGSKIYLVEEKIK